MSDEQKPVAWVGQNPRDGSIELCQFKPAPSVLLDFNMKPLYANPTPDVVKQLVEALVNSEDLIAGYLDTFLKLGDRMPYGHRVLSEAQAALAAAKEAGYD